MANISSFFPSSSGGVPVGGFAYFIVPSDTTFTAGQEVYTNPDDDTVWIRSGATITDSGSGVLDASTYTLEKEVMADQSTARFATTHVRSNRYGVNFDGKNVFMVGYNNSDVDYIIFDVDGSIIAGPTATTDQTISASVFYNDTHTFISSRPVNRGHNAGGTAIQYLQTSTLTNFAGYSANGSKNWIVPSVASGGSGDWKCAVTNAGLSNERHWWTRDQQTTIHETTFDATATNGTSAWTTTGNTITAPDGVGKLVAIGNDLYAHGGTKLHRYNATTRALVESITVPAESSSTSVSEIGVIAIPASLSDSGNNEFYFPNHNVNNNFSVTYNQWQQFNGIIGPKESDDGDAVVLTKNNELGTTFDVEKISANGEDIYLWQRIA